MAENNKTNSKVENSWRLFYSGSVSVGGGEVNNEGYCDGIRCDDGMLVVGAPYYSNFYFSHLEILLVKRARIFCDCLKKATPRTTSGKD